MFRLVNGNIMSKKEWKLYSEAEKAQLDYPEDKIDGTLYIVSIMGVR